MVERGIESILLSESATITIKSAMRMLPESDDRAGWDTLTRATAENDVWLKSNLVSSDSQMKAELKAECLAALSAVKQMTLYRQGKLDVYVDHYIADHIDSKMEALR